MHLFSALVVIAVLYAKKWASKSCLWLTRGALISSSAHQSNFNKYSCTNCAIRVYMQSHNDKQKILKAIILASCVYFFVALSFILLY